MGLFRYIVQGFGWHVGSHVAREGIEALERHDQGEPARPLSKREIAKLERERRRAAEREAARRREEKARREAAIESQLRELKKRADRT